MGEQVKTSLRIDAELLEEVQIACVRRKTTQTQAIEEGLKMWLAGLASPNVLVPVHPEVGVFRHSETMYDDLHDIGVLVRELERLAGHDAAVSLIHAGLEVARVAREDTAGRRAGRDVLDEAVEAIAEAREVLGETRRSSEPGRNRAKRPA